MSARSRAAEEREFQAEAAARERNRQRAPRTHEAMELVMEALESPRLRPARREYVESLAIQLSFLADVGKEISGSQLAVVTDAVQSCLELQNRKVDVA